jgi:truncated hemoglobin YjbI
MPLDNPRFRESYERLFGVRVTMGESADRFFERFYDLFLEDPEVAELFASTDMQRQVQMLKKSLFQLVSFYVLNEPSAELRRLAEIHKAVGVSPVMFDTWMQALLKTVEEFDPEFNELTELSWCWALAPAMTYMKLMLQR